LQAESRVLHGNCPMAAQQNDTRPYAKPTVANSGTDPPAENLGVICMRTCTIPRGRRTVGQHCGSNAVERRHSWKLSITGPHGEAGVRIGHTYSSCGLIPGQRQGLDDAWPPRIGSWCILNATGIPREPGFSGAFKR